MAGLAVEDVRERVQSAWDDVVSVLNKKISLAAVSAKGIAGDHMLKSAQYVAGVLREVGVDARVEQSKNPDGTPGAFEVVGSRIVNPSAPTVLLYAHHDVQPVPDPSEWETNPFEGTERDGRLYGRGSADDGGGIAIHYGALRALSDDLRVNIKVFIEGEEEMGSPSFIPFIESHKDEFESDVIIVADSGNWSAEIPSLTTSLRGNTDVDVKVKVLGHQVHSGQFGGPILDAYTLASMLVASLYNKDGDLAVPGIEAEEPVGGLQRDLDEAQVRADASVVDSYKLAGTGSLAARIWTKPSLTVIGMDAHPVEGSFNVIAHETKLRLSLTAEPIDNGMGWAMDPDAVATKDALASMRDAFGVEPVNKGEGGSIPFIPELQRIFPKAQVLVTGPEDPKSNAHSPNESISLPGLRGNIVTEALLLDRLGE